MGDPQDIRKQDHVVKGLFYLFHQHHVLSIHCGSENRMFVGVVSEFVVRVTSHIPRPNDLYWRVPNPCVTAHSMPQHAKTLIPSISRAVRASSVALQHLTLTNVNYRRPHAVP